MSDEVTNRPRVQRGMRFSRFGTAPAGIERPPAATDPLDAMVDRAEVRQAAKQRSAVAALAILLAGVLITAFGLGLAFGAVFGALCGLGVGLGTIGILMFIIGVLLGLNS